MGSNDNFSGGSWAAKVVNGIMNRTQKIAALNLGTVAADVRDDGIFRDPKLEKLDAYYENRQYDALLPWDMDKDAYGGAVPVRSKKPRLKVAFARTLVARVTSKLLGPTVFPAINIPDFPDDQEYFRAVVRESNLQSFLLEPTRRMLNTGEIFIRFFIGGGTFKKEWYPAKYCYPVYDDAGELELLTIQYVYSDLEDKDDNGAPKKKWFKLDLGNMVETKYDNPPYERGKEPEFQPVETAEHNFGFVQGEYMTTTGDPKGYGLICDITDFIDELCYSLSQSSKAVSYNQDPQLILSQMTEDEMADLIRSSSKGWNLGKSGEASFLETNLTGVQVAMELRDKVRLNIQDISRIVLLDPEKIVGNAQSAKAMEVLHGPLKDLVDELRMPIGGSLRKLITKMGAANILATEQGMEAPIMLPPGWKLQSLAIELKWPAIFQQTLEDLQKKVALAAQAHTTGIIAPRTATRYVAEDFGIDDIEEELKEIAAAQAAMAALNPFGGF